MRGYDTVGFGLGDILNAANPINHLKAAYGVVSNPFNPLKQTQALLNIFRGPAGSRGGAQQPPPQYMPPGAYQPQPAPGWGAPPPGFPSPFPSGYPPPPPGFAPMGFGAPPTFDYAASMPVDLNALYGPQTGWDAAYGGGSTIW